MSKTKGLTDLIESFNIFIKYGGSSDFHCGHDVLEYIGLDDEAIEGMSEEDIKKLDDLGFSLSREGGVKHFRRWM